MINWASILAPKPLITCTNC